MNINALFDMVAGMERNDPGFAALELSELRKSDADKPIKAKHNKTSTDVTQSCKAKAVRTTGIKKEKDAENIIEIIDGSDEKGQEGIDKHVKGHLGEPGAANDNNDKYGAAAHFQQYQQLLDQYKRFLDAYLKETQNIAASQYNYSSSSEDEKRKFEWGQEVVTYAEVKETVRKIKMNMLLGGWHNQVNPDDQDRYKFWKYTSKFNKVMAEVIENAVGSGG
jgi:hypothetical protein